MKHLFFLLLVFTLFFSCEKKQEPIQQVVKINPIESKAFDSLPKQEQSRIEKYFTDNAGLDTYVMTPSCVIYSDTALTQPIDTLSFCTQVINYTGQYAEVGYKTIGSWRHKVVAVRFSTNAKDSLNGFTLETNVSFFANRTSDGNLIMAGFDNFQNELLTGQLLVIDPIAGLTVDKKSFEMTGGIKGDDGINYYSYYTEGKITHEHAASEFTDVISIYMYYPACGYMSSEQWFNYKNGKINFISECLHMGHAGAAAAWCYLIFPEEKNGQANCIFKVDRFEEYEYDEDLQDRKAFNPDSSLIRLTWDMTKGVVKIDTLYNDFDR